MNRWTEPEDTLLRKLYYDGKPRKEIARIMGMKYRRVNCRIETLRLPSTNQERGLGKSVLAMLAAGYSVAEVAATFGLTESHVIGFKKDKIQREG